MWKPSAGPDGVRVNEADGAQVHLSLVPEAAVERVELVRGPVGVFGKNAIAGALNVITRRGTAAPTLEAEIEAGSFGMASAAASASAPLGPLDALVTGSYSRSTGWRLLQGSEELSLFDFTDPKEVDVWHEENTGRDKAWYSKEVKDDGSTQKRVVAENIVALILTPLRPSRPGESGEKHWPLSNNYIYDSRERISEGRVDPQEPQAEHQRVPGTDPEDLGRPLPQPQPLRLDGADPIPGWVGHWPPDPQAHRHRPDVRVHGDQPAFGDHIHPWASASILISDLAGRHGMPRMPQLCS